MKIKIGINTTEQSLNQNINKAIANKINQNRDG